MILYLLYCAPPDLDPLLQLLVSGLLVLLIFGHMEVPFRLPIGGLGRVLFPPFDQLLIPPKHLLVIDLLEFKLHARPIGFLLLHHLLFVGAAV